MDRITGRKTTKGWLELRGFIDLARLNSARVFPYTGRHRGPTAATDRPSVENYQIGCGL
jgi:hypothetical protein